MFRLGQLSESHLEGVDLDLVACVRWAILITVQDFSVFEGLRTLERQKKLVAAGASRTLDSYHLPDRFGLSHAVDLVPFIDGKQQWQDAPCLRVAEAMHMAATRNAVEVTWGAVWDRPLRLLNRQDLASEIEAYRARWHKAHPRPVDHEGGWEPLIDRPHFQVPRPPVLAKAA